MSCKRMYPETKYLKFALGFHPQETSLNDTDFYSFIQLINETNYVGEVGLDFSKKVIFRVINNVYILRKLQRCVQKRIN